MLTLQLPMLLALLGTALMAVVIFAPAHVPAPATISFAPPPAPVHGERWDPPADTPGSALSGDDPFAARAPDWPALVDPSAADCDAASRLALVDALWAVRAPWAETILRRALDVEPETFVRAAIAAALAA
jgi:hypothetical protein